MRFIFNEDQILRLKQRLSKESINEDFLDDLISKGADYVKKGVSSVKDYISGLDVDVEKKASDVPTKADYIGDNVEDFYKILENIDEPISEQKYGSMSRQQGVEATQIGLQLVGYSLPKFGTDGLFGPETAAAVKKFKSDNNIGNAPVTEAFVEIGDTNYSHVKVDADTKYDQVNQDLLDDLQAAGQAAGVVLTITTAVSGHSKKTINGRDSRHGFGTAVDIALLNGVGVGNPKFKTYGDAVKDALTSMGYSWNTESGNSKAVLWQTNTGGNHYNHLHVSNNQNVSGAPAGLAKEGGETITPEMISVLITKLKEKNITSEDIKQYIDPAVTTGGSVDFTDLDLNTTEGVESYKKICDNFIDQRNPNAEVNGEMMADAAERVFKRYGKYIPPELALAQLTLEGGISKNPNDRPIKTKNPFNVGNTAKKDNPQASFKDGVNLYYDLIARKYLVKGKTAADLVNDFKNEQGLAYAEAGTYETGLKSLIKNIRDKNAPVYAQLKMKNQSTLAEELLNEADKRQAIKNAFGFNDDWANEFHNLSDKLSIWIADTMVKEYIRNLQMTDIDLNGKDPKQYTVELFNNNSPSTFPTWDRIYKPKYEYVMHWVRAPRREPLNIRDMSLDDAYSQAQEWHDTLQARKQSNYQETGDVFIDYRNADGVGYYWVHLGKGYCNDESERMGHCGRSNTGKLISFRRINEFGEGESYLTVDYRPGGIVGDFHRHGNKKPTSRFHKQIVDFLINTTYPVTQLTQQGVHRYEDNFQLADLSADDLRKVYQGNAVLRFDINNSDNWPEIIEAILNNELTFSQFSNKVRAELLAKAIEMDKGEEFSAKFTDKMVVDTIDDFGTISSNVKRVYVNNFAERINDILTKQLDKKTTTEAAMEFFADALKEISQELFDSYQLFCGFIDHGFRKFNEEQRIAIISQRGIKRSLYSCSEILPFLTRFAENSPVDSNGNIAVKTEDGYWGLIKQNGETILHPQFLGVGQNKIDRTGKTYLIKNVQNVFYSFNPESGEYKKYTMKG